MFWSIFLETLAMIVGVLLVAMIVHWLVHRDAGQRNEDA